MYRASSHRDRPAGRDVAGFGLIEVLVALAVLALGIVALERLAARSAGTLRAEAARTRALLAARALLADAALEVPEPGTWAGTAAGGLRAEREVRRTPHPALAEVVVRVWPDEPWAAPCELVEVVRAARP